VGKCLDTCWQPSCTQPPLLPPSSHPHVDLVVLTPQQWIFYPHISPGPSNLAVSIGILASVPDSFHSSQCSVLYNSTDLLFTNTVRSESTGILNYSGSNFEFICPAGAMHCTDWQEIWHGGSTNAKFHSHLCKLRHRAKKLKFLKTKFRNINAP